MTSINEVEAYWDARPCNLHHSPRPVGTYDYFADVEHRKYFVEPHIPGFAEFDQWTGQNVFEVGCGIGTDTMNFAKVAKHVTAIDISSRSLDLAKQRARALGLENKITFIHGNIEDARHILEFACKGERPDLVYSFGVLHHTPDPQRALNLLWAMGHIHTVYKIMVYHRLSTKAIGLRLRGKDVASNSEAQYGCPVTHLFSKDEARAWFKTAGLKIDSMRVAHIFPYEVEPYRHYRYVKRWYYRHWPRWAWNALESTLGWHLLIEGHREI